MGVHLHESSLHFPQYEGIRVIPPHLPALTEDLKSMVPSLIFILNILCYFSKLITYSYLYRIFLHFISNSTSSSSNTSSLPYKKKWAMRITAVIFVKTWLLKIQENDLEPRNWRQMRRSILSSKGMNGVI